MCHPLQSRLMLVGGGSCEFRSPQPEQLKAGGSDGRAGAPPVLEAGTEDLSTFLASASARAGSGARLSLLSSGCHVGGIPRRGGVGSGVPVMRALVSVVRLVRLSRSLDSHSRMS